MSMLELEALRVAPLITQPFPYFTVPEFVKQEALESLRADFPRIGRGGSFPLAALEYGPAFERLCDELNGPEMRDTFAEKFSLDLSGRPTTLTVRGQTRAKDGQIHTDSKTKLITVLLYLNPAWNGDGGCLRLLRSGTDIDDVIEEILPTEGTLVAFRCTPNAWHGHKPFVGERRSLQLNWVVDESAARRSGRRHGLSALVKRINPFATRTEKRPAA